MSGFRFSMSHLRASATLLCDDHAQWLLHVVGDLKGQGHSEFMLSEDTAMSPKALYLILRLSEDHEMLSGMACCYSEEAGRARGLAH